jgi:hypothetical protein
LHISKKSCTFAVEIKDKAFRNSQYIDKIPREGRVKEMVIPVIQSQIRSFETVTRLCDLAQECIERQLVKPQVLRYVRSAFSPSF